MVELSLGIDFGTTTTSIAFREEGLFPEVLPIGENEQLYMPSAVAFIPESDGAYQTVIGEDALRVGVGADLITSIKRCLGCDGSRCKSSQNTEGRRRATTPSLYNSGQCDAGRIRAGGRSWLPQEIALLIVEEALQRASHILRTRYGVNDLEDLSVFPANLGCSTVFNLAQRQAMVGIARGLGFGRVRLANVVEEPIAAGVGFAYLEGLKPSRILVYDFGGGTFDAAIVDVNLSATKVAVLASGGVAFLGGDDIDAILVDFFLEQIGQETGYTSTEIRELLKPGTDERVLRIEAEKTKIELSSETDVEVVLPLSLRNDVFSFSISRSHFDLLIASERRFDGVPLFKRSLQCVEEVARKARVYSDMRERGGSIDKQSLLKQSLQDLISQVDHVLLVGGVTKIPYIRNELANTFGRRRIFDGDFITDPITPVAKGATLDKEYENLVLPAPPYSIVAYLHKHDGVSEPQTLYTAYDILWPNSHSGGRSDFRYIGDPIFLHGGATVGILQPGTEDFLELCRVHAAGHLRVDIDETAHIYVLTGSSEGSMNVVCRTVAPWQHEVQIMPVPTKIRLGHLNDPANSLLLSN